MLEKITEAIDTKKTNSPEVQGPTSVIGKIIKKVRDSISTVFKTGGGFLAFGLKKAGKFLGRNFGFNPAALLPDKKPEEEKSKPEKPKEEKPKEKPVETAKSDLLELPTGLSFQNKSGNSVSPDKKIARIVCKNGPNFGLSDNDAPDCTVNNDGTITVKQSDGKEKKYHVDTLLSEEDGYTAHLNPDKPAHIRVLEKADLDLFQEAEAANDNSGDNSGEQNEDSGNKSKERKRKNRKKRLAA